MGTWKENWKLPFFGIWAGQVFSLLGSTVVQFALVWWLTTSTESATVLASASLVALLPEIILGPFIGVYIDRWNRRMVMIVADSLVALISLWLAYLFWAGNVQIWHVYVALFARSIGEGFHRTAMHVSTSLMVPDDQLARVAGLNQTMQGVQTIVGPPLGALLMTALLVQGAILVDVVTALVAVVPLLFVKIPQPRRDDAKHPVKPSVWTDMREGFLYIRGWRGLMILIGAAMLFKIAMTPAFSLMPLLVTQHFGGGAAQLSLLESVAGVGIVCGGLLLGAWGGFRRRIFTSLTGLVVAGLGFVLLGLAPGDLWGLALGSVFLLGLMIPMADGPLLAILQASVAPELQGRVFTTMSSLLNITGPLSLAVAGPVSDWLGIQAFYLAAGTLTAGVGLAMFFVPEVVDIERR